MQWSLLRPVGLVPAALVVTTIAASAEGGKSAGPSEFLLVAQIVLLIAVGRGLGEIMQRIGQPSVMGQLLAGILLGLLAVLGPGDRDDPLGHDPRQGDLAGRRAGLAD